MAASLSGSMLVSINKVTLGQAQLVLEWVTGCREGKAPWFVISHSGHLSLLLSVGQKMSTNQSAVTLCSWGSKGKYGLFHLWINVWVAGKTV